MSEEKKGSPFKIAPVLALGGKIALAGMGAKIGMGLWAGAKARKAEREARAQEIKSRREMNRLRNVYANLDTSNPFMNMENPMEDLTVNQQQFEMQRQMTQQSQATTLDSLRGAAGGSGIAALAQSMAQQGQMASQRAAAQIGQQEAANQKAAAAQATAIQKMERQGEIRSRNWERDKQGTLLGMAQEETAAYAKQAQEAQQQKFEAIAGGFGDAINMGFSAFGPGGGGFK